MVADFGLLVSDFNWIHFHPCPFKGKVYDSEEQEAKHRAVFMDNIKVIEQHNWQYFNMKKSYYLGINQFTDMVSGLLGLSSFVLSWSAIYRLTWQPSNPSRPSPLLQIKGF